MRLAEKKNQHENEFRKMDRQLALITFTNVMCWYQSTDDQMEKNDRALN
jgi:hypothetical protein